MIHTLNNNPCLDIDDMCIDKQIDGGVYHIWYLFVMVKSSNKNLSKKCEMCLKMNKCFLSFFTNDIYAGYI